MGSWVCQQSQAKLPVMQVNDHPLARLTRKFCAHAGCRDAGNEAAVQHSSCMQDAAQWLAAGSAAHCCQGVGCLLSRSHIASCANDLSCTGVQLVWQRVSTCRHSEALSTSVQHKAALVHDYTPTVPLQALGSPVRPERPKSQTSQLPRPLSQWAAMVPRAPRPPVITKEPARQLVAWDSTVSLACRLEHSQ